MNAVRILVFAGAMLIVGGCGEKAGDSGAASTGGAASPPAGGDEAPAPTRPDPGPAKQEEPTEVAEDSRAGMRALIEAWYAAISAGKLEAQLALCTEELAEQVEASLAGKHGTYDKTELAKRYKASPKKADYEILKVTPNVMDPSYGTVTVKRVHAEYEDELTFHVTRKKGTWLIQRADSERRGHGMGAD